MPLPIAATQVVGDLVGRVTRVDEASLQGSAEWVILTPTRTQSPAAI